MDINSMIAKAIDDGNIEVHESLLIPEFELFSLNGWCEKKNNGRDWHDTKDPISSIVFSFPEEYKDNRDRKRNGNGVIYIIKKGLGVAMPLVDYLKYGYSHKNKEIGKSYQGMNTANTLVVYGDLETLSKDDLIALAKTSK